MQKHVINENQIKMRVNKHKNKKVDLTKSSAITIDAYYHKVLFALAETTRRTMISYIREWTDDFLKNNPDKKHEIEVYLDEQV